MSDFIVYSHHLSNLACRKGCRKFYKERGWDWEVFLKEGIPAQTLRDTGDAMVIGLLEELEVSLGRRR